MAFPKFARGGPDYQALKAVMAERQAIGFNCARSFFYVDVPGIGTFTPNDLALGKAAAGLSSFCDFLAGYGSYLNLCIGSWPYTWLGGASFDGERWTGGDYRNWLMDVWLACGEVLAKKSNVALLSLVNENDSGENGQQISASDAVSWPAIPGVICSIGSWLGSPQAVGWPPNNPAMQVVEMHGGGSEWPQEAGHNSMEMADTYNQAGFTSETPRYPEGDQSLNHSYDAARGSALLNAAYCYHAVHGKTTELFAPGVEYDAAVQACMGAKSMPLDFQHAGYQHRVWEEGDLNAPVGTPAHPYARCYGRGTSPTAAIRP